MAVLIGQFNHPEAGGIYGRSGDQLKPAALPEMAPFEGEVNIAYVGSGWKRIFRPVDAETARKIADLMHAAALNPHIGYSQGPTRYSFGDALRLAGNDPARITTDCNADCSSGTAAILNAAGCGVKAEMTTATEKSDLMATRRFLLIEDEDLIRPELMQRGDILWRQGHTAIVISAPDWDPLFMEMYASERCNMRLGPGISYQSIGEIEAGRGVVAIEPYIGPKNWALVEVGKSRCWASLKYIKPNDPEDVLRVTGWRVNIRSGADVLAPVLEVASLGSFYIRCYPDRTDERGVLWYAVYLKTEIGSIGYISSKYAEVL